MGPLRSAGVLIQVSESIQALSLQTHIPFCLYSRRVSRKQKQGILQNHESPAPAYPSRQAHVEKN